MSGFSRSTLLASIAIVIFVIIQTAYVQTAGQFTLKDLWLNLAFLIVLVVVIFMFCGGGSGKHE